MKNTKKINWVPVLFLTSYHMMLLVLLPLYLYYYVPAAGLLATSFILFVLTGISITAGYHRYYAHRSYRTNSIVEGVLLFFSSMAAQSSALRWAYEHRLHHAHVDTEEDPYSVQNGFWYAHCLWILNKPRNVESKVVSDLLRNKMVVFQQTYYKYLMIGSNVLAILFFGWVFNDYFGAFVFVGLFRMFALHHCTWFINSLAHMWGDKPFCQELTAVDNYFLSFLTFGEGYHNYHHTFANDYRNGVRWFHFDPTKWLIWSLNKLGLAHGLKRMDPVTIEKRVILESKDLLLEQIKKSCHLRKEELENLVQDMSERIVAKVAQFNRLKEKYLAAKKERPPRDIMKSLRYELRSYKKSLKQDWQQWMAIYNSIMELEHLPA